MSMYACKFNVLAGVIGAMIPAIGGRLSAVIMFSDVRMPLSAFRASSMLLSLLGSFCSSSAVWKYT